MTLTVSNSAGQDEVVEMNYISVGAGPTASFTAGVNGFDVDFTNNSINPANSGNLTFDWDFGDGNSSTDESPQHTYAGDGTYDVTFTVTNDCGLATTNGQVTIVTLPTRRFQCGYDFRLCANGSAVHQPVFPKLGNVYVGIPRRRSFHFH